MTPDWWWDLREVEAAYDALMEVMYTKHEA